MLRIEYRVVEEKLVEERRAPYGHHCIRSFPTGHQGTEIPEMRRTCIGHVRSCGSGLKAHGITSGGHIGGIDSDLRGDREAEGHRDQNKGAGIVLHEAKVIHVGT